MPKIVDHGQRREDLGRAVWRVIGREGVDGASVRNVAREAGCSAGSLRHYFSSQSELLSFAMQLVVERITARIAALEIPEDARAGVEQLLFELLPVDCDRAAENEVWVAFTGRALVDPELRTRHHEIDDALRQACSAAIQRLAAAGRVHPGTDQALEAARLHALCDGLALQNALRPDRPSPATIVTVVVGHLDSLDPARTAQAPVSAKHRG